MRASGSPIEQRSSAEGGEADARVSRADIVSFVVQAVVDLDPPRLAADSAITVETPLFGENGVLDSLGLVALIVDVEEMLSDEVGRPIPLADDRAMSQTRSPFRTVGSLADYALALVREDG